MIQMRGLSGIFTERIGSIKISITTKLILSFLLIIIMTSAIFTVVGIILISDHIKDDARGQVLDDLDEARDIYLTKQSGINNVVTSTANNFQVREGVLSGEMDQAINELVGIKIRQALDILTVTDGSGEVLYRTGNPKISGDTIAYYKLINSVISEEMPVSGTTILTAEDLITESPLNAKNLSVSFAQSFGLQPGEDVSYQEAMILGAAAPIITSDDDLVGVVYGGVLLNNNRDFICDIRQSIYQNKKYDNQDMGFISIYQNDTELLTCPGTGPGLVIVEQSDADDIVSSVIEDGTRWFGRNMIGDSRYVTVYEPIKNSDFDPVGMLQVGQLEQRYLDINNQIVVAFLSITLVGALIAALFAYFIAQGISVPLKKLVAVSAKVAQGDLDARVDINSMSNDEIGEFADAFNSMAIALKQRDEKLMELTSSRISRSERLALIGKLSANVAHELNNPLQGIVTYSHLLLEQMSVEDHNVKAVEVIVTQANRCREIIRGLLDFSRQREPDKGLNDVNLILYEAISLVEHQALFHNIKIVKEFDAQLPMTILDPSQIERVFVNMIVNAAEAMEGSGTLTLKTDFNPFDEAIEITVSDTGCGISEENIRRVFDPFFTTKEVGQGTGLGLAISYGIIGEHGGKVSLETEIGRGTTFIVILPVETKAVIQGAYE
jgi:two-component system NtrC family sensor kinase